MMMNYIAIFALGICILISSPLSAASPVLVDTDIGDDIDDALALGLVLSSPELDVRGITTVQGDATTRANLMCRFLHFIKKSDIPVSSGAKAHNPPDFNGQMQYAMRPAPGQRPVKESAAKFLYAKRK